MLTDVKPAPAHVAIEYELRAVDGLAENSVFAGYPSAKSDAAWNALVEGQFPPAAVKSTSHCHAD